jgi:hypothetical protein
MKYGEVTSRDLLLGLPEVARDVKLIDALQWIPGIKRSRALKVMSGLVFMEGMPLGRLSLRTRERLYERVAHLQPTYSHIHHRSHAA